MDLELLSRFVAVAETASFSVAAKRLRLPKSSVSRGVARLEDALGTQLLHRTTRQVTLSAAGAALYERAAPLLLSLREAVGALPDQKEQPSPSEIWRKVASCASCRAIDYVPRAACTSSTPPRAMCRPRAPRFAIFYSRP